MYVCVCVRARLCVCMRVCMCVRDCVCVCPSLTSSNICETFLTLIPTTLSSTQSQRPPRQSCISPATTNTVPASRYFSRATRLRTLGCCSNMPSFFFLLVDYAQSKAARQKALFDFLLVTRASCRVISGEMLSGTRVSGDGGAEELHLKLR